VSKGAAHQVFLRSSLEIVVASIWNLFAGLDFLRSFDLTSVQVNNKYMQECPEL
jgi:hypothetical protein